MKENKVMSRLFGYMGLFKITMIISIILSAVSAVINLYAFVCVYNVMKEIVQSLGDIHSLDQAYMVNILSSRPLECMVWHCYFPILPPLIQ